MTFLRGSNSTFRQKVHSRDRGICSECGLDTEALAQRYREAEERDRAASGGTFACLTCTAIGNSKPCDECGSRLQQTVEVNDHRAAIVREASERYRFKAVEFIRLMQSKQSLWVADHRTPLSEGGDDTLDNGRTLCRACDGRITGAQTRERNRSLARARKPANVAKSILKTMRGKR